MGLNSHDAIAHQKMGLFSTRRARKKLGLSSEAWGQTKKKKKAMKMFGMFPANIWV